MSAMLTSIQNYSDAACVECQTPQLVWNTIMGKEGIT